MEAPAIVAGAKCPHAMSTIAFQRTGTRLHPVVLMIEYCIDCAAELDRKRISRGERSAFRYDKS